MANKHKHNNRGKRSGSKGLRDRLTEIMDRQTGMTVATVFLKNGTQEEIVSDGTYYGQMLVCLAIKAARGDLQAISMVLDLMRDTENE